MSLTSPTAVPLCSGLAEQFGFRSDQRTFEDPELGLGDKIQLVKQVGQTVQNLSGQLADVLEKSQKYRS